MRYIGLVLSVMLFLSSCSQKEKEQEQVSIKIGDVISLKSVSGESKKLKRIKGGFELVGEEDKLLMFDFFGTFCPPCRQEASDLTRFQVKNAKSLVLLGFTSFENVSDKYVLDHFADKYGAYYFIANSKQNAQIAKLVLEDIAYPQAMQLPFKVLLKKGVYQTLTDVWGGTSGVKFYIGGIGTDVMQKDIDRIEKSK